MTQDPQAVVFVATNKIACDGHQKHLGHPRVYLDLPVDQNVACPYCSQEYCHAAHDSAQKKAP